MVDEYKTLGDFWYYKTDKTIEIYKKNSNSFESVTFENVTLHFDLRGNLVSITIKRK